MLPKITRHQISKVFSATKITAVIGIPFYVCTGVAFYLGFPKGYYAFLPMIGYVFGLAILIKTECKVKPAETKV